MFHFKFYNSRCDASCVYLIVPAILLSAECRMREVTRCQPGLMSSHTGGQRGVALPRSIHAVHAGKRGPLLRPSCAQARNGVQGRLGLLQTPKSASGLQREQPDVHVEMLPRECVNIISYQINSAPACIDQPFETESSAELRPSLETCGECRCHIVMNFACELLNNRLFSTGLCYNLP